MSLSSHYDRDSAKNFLKHQDFPNLSYLIYRDLPGLLKKYVPMGRALDFGCGPGLSTRFLAKLGYEVAGVDINRYMLETALHLPDGIPFAWIEHGKTSFKSNSFDLVLSVMVLLEMPSLTQMEEAVSEISRIVKPGGIFLSVVGSEHFHQVDWFDKTTLNREKCQNLNTGDAFHTLSKSTGITFRDYFYTNEDYISVFKKGNFKLLEIHRALGCAEDKMPWTNELALNPFTHYICQKNALPNSSAF